MFINRFLKRFVSPEKYARLIGVNMGKITFSSGTILNYNWKFTSNYIITKFTVWLSFLTVLFFTTGCNNGYDDSELTGRVENIENKVRKLEEQMNSNISSLQSIIEALNNNDYITSITPIIEGGKEIGYTTCWRN